MLRRLAFELRYRIGRAPWDTRITPPELVAFVAERGPGRALDLGCGTGTNVLYLAERGWHAVGVDFSPRAIAIAQRRARESRLAAAFRVADVTRLPDLGEPFDLALDMGCLHSLPADKREGYARELVRILAPGGTYLLYAFCPPSELGIARDEVARLFASLRLVSFIEGTGRPSAWYRFARS